MVRQTVGYHRYEGLEAAATLARLYAEGKRKAARGLIRHSEPDAADHERISLRYLFGPGEMGGAGMAKVNASLQGPLRLSDTREDLAADGSARIRRNIVNQG